MFHFVCLFDWKIALTKFFGLGNIRTKSFHHLDRLYLSLEQLFAARMRHSGRLRLKNSLRLRRFCVVIYLYILECWLGFRTWTWTWIASPWRNLLLFIQFLLKRIIPKGLSSSKNWRNSSFRLKRGSEINFLIWLSHKTWFDFARISLFFFLRGGIWIWLRFRLWFFFVRTFLCIASFELWISFDVEERFYHGRFFPVTLFLFLLILRLFEKSFRIAEIRLNKRSLFRGLIWV